MTALTLADGAPRALALTDDELIPTLRSSLYPGATDASIKLVTAWCRATGKDPMKKPVHLVPMRVKKVGGGRDDYEWRDVVMPGIVDYRTDASRTGQHAGNDEAVFGPDVTRTFGRGEDDCTITYPEWCEFKVYRLVAGQRVPFSSGRVRWVESYATAGSKTDAPNAMWRKRPYGQLEKCAEAMALRRAFPEVGAQPTADEMAGRTVAGDEFEVDGVTVQSAAAPAGPTVARKPRPSAAPAPADVSDAVPAAPAASAGVSAEEKAAVTAPAQAAAPAPSGDKMVGPGEIAYMGNKARSIGADLAEVAAAVGLQGVVIEAGKLSKADFDTVKAELLKRGA